MLVPIIKIDINEFLLLRNTTSVIVMDVRSEGEFAHAHIPGACSLPLFDNEERKVVGTIYKKESRENAIKVGLKYFGPKMATMIEEVEKITGISKDDKAMAHTKSVIVHCWRGGMRSAGVAWLLDLYGFKVYTLFGGYKSFRRWVLLQFEQTYPLSVIGGYTGSGKTELLHLLASQGQTIIDLERIARHKGSAFGNLDEVKQPSQELFENQLAIELYKVNASNKPVWIEDESRRIGTVNIPQGLFASMQSAAIVILDLPFERRLQHIIEHYGSCNKEKLINAIIRIKKRLGPNDTKMAIAYLTDNNIEDCFAILLKYYDKWYSKSQAGTHDKLKRKIDKVPMNHIGDESVAAFLTGNYEISLQND